MDIKDLQKACSVLGLDYKEFVEVPEVEKGVTDYKTLYEQQKSLNEKILGNIGEISKSFDSQLEKFKTTVSDDMKEQITELKKSFGSLEKEFNGMKNSPMRKAKSADKVTVIEKAVQQNNGAKTYELQNFADLKALKGYLMDKTMQDLEKGVTNGIYEKAALQLDASRKISPDLVKKIFEKDNILIK